MWLIDADALYKFHVSSYSGEDLSEFSNGWNYCIKHLAKHAPTIDAAPVVHAKWLYDRPQHYKCSACKSMWGELMKRVAHFCPNCGAKMDGGTEG